jgi:hypothetical protein
VDEEWTEWTEFVEANFNAVTYSARELADAPASLDGPVEYTFAIRCSNEDRF